MTSKGADALKGAIRRSLPIIVALVVLGVVAVNAVTHLRGPQYQATSAVEIAATPLSAIITGTQPAFVDPQSVQNTALSLAGSPQVYGLAAQQSGDRFGSAGSLQSHTSVTPVSNTDILQFTASNADPARAIGIANTVAAGYVAFRGQLTSSQIAQTIAKISATSDTLPAGSTQRAQAQQELNRLQLLQGASSSDAVVVQEAIKAAKTSPAPVKDTILGFSLGLVIALIAVALREAVDTMVRSETDVEDLLSVPVLATIPSLPRKTKIVTFGRHEAAFRDTFSLLAAQLTPSRQAGHGQLLAVTSALAQEGKTTTAVNLGIVAALRGMDVLLADFDFRKPALSAAFDIPKGVPGAIQVLEGSAPLDTVLWEVALQGSRLTASPANEVEGAARGADEAVEPGLTGKDRGGLGTLRILPSGGSHSTIAGQRAQLGPLLRRMHNQADLVILDTPPALLTVEMTELARLIDMVVVVVRQGRVSQRTLRNLGRRAQAWEADVVGAVLTDVPAAGNYSYYGPR